MATIFLFFTGFVSLPEVSAQWGFTIGLKEVPPVVIQKDPSAFRVYPNHPRLFFRDTDLPVIRERIKGEFSKEWREMIADLEERAVNVPASTFAEGSYLKNWTTGRNMAFAALLTGDERYIRWSKEWAAAMAAAGPAGIDDQYRGRLQSMAVAYDWLLPWLSPDEKGNLQKAIIEHIDKNWYFATGSDHVGGHSRWGNSALAIGLLSLVTDIPELKEKILKVRENWISGYHPLQGWIAVDGGYHMGWSYSAAYLTSENHCVWSSATNECVYYPWRGLLPLFWIYGRQGDGTYPYTGDAYFVQGIDFNQESDLMVIAAGVYKNPHAAWMIRERPDRFADILYGDKSVSPQHPQNSLPLSRYFRNAGVVMARDRWDENSTVFQFRSVPFYSANHHHRDENCFTLHYRGALAVDAGFYDSYGSEHWRNYFTRTIAHNGIIVFDPAQKMLVYNSPASNDGGQTYRKEPTRLPDILPGGHAYLDGITQYVDTKEYTYSAGDATKAYDPERVKLAQREVVYLRTTDKSHPVIVIFDRVESTRPEFEKKFLLHTVNEPLIKGKFSIVENNGGKLTCLTLLPESARIELIGGEGKEAWVDGKNYPFESRRNTRPLKEFGMWRLEVSPVTKQTVDYFLHVLFIDDTGAPLPGPKETGLMKKTDSVGVVVAGWNLTFPLKPGGKTEIMRKK